MHKRLPILLVLLILGIAVGCASITEIENPTLRQVTLVEKDDGSYYMSHVAASNSQSLGFGRESEDETFAVVVQFELPDGLTPESFKGAMLQIPISAMTQNRPTRPETPTREERERTHSVTYAAYRIVDPAWMQSRQFDTVADAKAADHATLKGALKDYESMKEYLQFNITEIVKAWAAGEPNLGIFLWPTDAEQLEPGVHWKFVLPPPAHVRDRPLPPPSETAVRTWEEREAKVTIWH